MKHVHYLIDGPLCSLVLDNQHNRNALSRQLISELTAGLDRAEDDPRIRVILLRQAGPVFCSGADLSEQTSTDPTEAPRALIALQRRIVGHSKPIVARVSGAARAGGIGLLGAADITIAAEDATFALPEARLGVAPAVISLVLLPRMTPRAASLTFLTGQVFTGRDAAEFGLVTMAVPASELDHEVERICALLGKSSPQGLRETKRLLTETTAAELNERGTAMADLSANLFASEEAQQAMREFLARPKRK